ncbi:MAG: nuclear transport factor 2 family protein [Sphingomonadaceae bacterium]|nr:nuclear transport factor 2 family protein [Sphingomonadaceae bacterium]
MTKSDDLTSRLQRLEDLEAIRNLIASYGPLADSGDAQGLARLWAEDGEYAVGGFGTARGHAEIAALIEGEVHQQLMAGGCAHVLSPHRVMLDGVRAEATGYSVVFRKAGDSHEAWRVSANRWLLERTGAGWWVKRRENAPLDGTEGARSLLVSGSD